MRARERAESRLMQSGGGGIMPTVDGVPLRSPSFDDDSNKEYRGERYRPFSFFVSPIIYRYHLLNIII